MPDDNYSWLEEAGNDPRPAPPAPAPPPPAANPSASSPAPWLAPANPQAAAAPPPPPDWIEVPQRSTPPPASTTDRLAAELLATQPPDQRESFHVDKHTRRGRRRIAFIVVVVVAIILALNQFTDLGNSTRIRALDPGDCIEMPDNHYDRYVSRVDCIEPHDAEVVGHISLGVGDRLDACADMLVTLHPELGGQLPGDAQVRVLTGAMLDRCVVHSPTASWTGSALGPRADGG